VLVRHVEPGEGAGPEQGARQPQRPARQPPLLLRLLVVVGEQPPHHGEGVLLPGDDVDQHRVVDLHPGAQRLGIARDELVEGLLGPHDGARGRLLQLRLRLLLRVGGVARLGPGLGLLVLDHVLGRLHDDVSHGVEAGPPGPPGDLSELTHLEHPLPVAVELGEAGEEHGPDRHVDADAEGVGAADDRQQSGLGEVLDEPPVLRQHPRVVHPDPRAEQPRQRLAEPGAEPDRRHPGRDRLLVDPEVASSSEQGGGVLDRGRLREVNDVHGRLPGGHELLERLVERVEGPGVGQRHRPLGLVHDRGLAAVATRQVLGDRGDVAQRRRHQHELRLRQLQERHLPGPAAVGLRVEVELVHDHQADVRPRPLAQGDVGEHLGRAADDRGVGVDGRVPGEQPDVLGAEDLAEREELLAHERLDGSGVEAHPVVGQRGAVRGLGHERLARPGRRGQHDVAPRQQLDDRLVLVRVELEARAGGVLDDLGVDLVRRHPRARGCAVAKTSRRLSTVTRV
jgi:hypothetical protein